MFVRFGSRQVRLEEGSKDLQSVCEEHMRNPLDAMRTDVRYGPTGSVEREPLGTGPVSRFDWIKEVLDKESLEQAQ